MRLEYELSHLAGREIRDFLTRQLGHLRKDIYIDKMLLFHSALFDGNEFTTYNFPDGAQKMAGTIRYRPNLIRIPANTELPAYETDEFNAKKPPRGLVAIPQITVCAFNQLSRMELRRAGFKDNAEALEGMRLHYSDIQKDSIVSFYDFGNYRAKPSRKAVEHVLEQMKS